MLELGTLCCCREHQLASLSNTAMLCGAECIHPCSHHTVGGRADQLDRMEFGNGTSMNVRLTTQDLA